jgi:hypothetical protein
MATATHPPTGLKSRFWHEMTQYGVICLYLYICFGAIILDRTATLRTVGVGAMPWGLAAVKALVLGKFIMAGHMVHLGERYRNRPLIFPVLYKSVVFLGLVFAATVLEDVIRGLIKGETMVAALGELMGGHRLQIVTTCILMWLILLPYFAIREIGEALGEGRLKQMFFGRA